jgi:hypothetical protein
MLADESGLLYIGGNFTTLPNQLSLLLRLGEAFHTGRGLSFDERGPSPLRMLSSLRYCRRHHRPMGSPRRRENDTHLNLVIDRRLMQLWWRHA